MSKTNLNVVSESTEESNFEIQPFPKPWNSTTMKLDDFLDIPTFPKNRQVELRAKNTAELLTEPLPKHCEVDIALYTGETVHDPAYFRKGAQYVLNGNTRQHIWSQQMKGNPVNRKVTFLPIPDEVCVNIYEFDDVHKMIRVYHTIDSTEAVESPGDKVTGSFRAKGLLEHFQNMKLKKGQIKLALDTACPYGTKTQHVVPGVTDQLDQVEKLKKVLVAYDKMNAPGRGALSTQLSSGIGLLAGIVMGHDNKVWLDTIKDLTSFSVKDPVLTDILNTNDGTEWILKGIVTNPCGVEFEKALPFKMGLFNGRQLQINYLAYCWTKIIDNEPMTLAPTYSDVANAYSKLLNRAWSSDE
tara:strand:+ start:155 stop:1222 length:1068 start_codon:yes stop_codon:yes gene_type:complete